MKINLMTSVVILQARLTSSRLPGKVLKPLAGAPMIQRQIERLRRAKGVDDLVLATSHEPSDDPIAELAKKIDVNCFRGSLNDVLDRFYQAARALNPTHVLRLTGDCPLSDPDVVDKVLSEHIAGGADYTSN